MRLGDMVNSALHPLGMELRRYPAASEFEADLMHILRTLGVNCILDVGAHWGEFGRKVRRLGFGGRIASFEPGSEALVRLHAVASGAPDWRIRAEAVAEHGGRVALNVSRSTSMASLLRPSPLGIERMGEKLDIVAVENVTAVRLDEVWDECCAGLREPVVFLKVDAQGLDLAVIRSAGDRLSGVAAVLLESAVSAAIYHGAPAFGDALATLEPAGFHLSTVAPINRGADLRVVELDCLFCRAHA